MPPSPSRRDVVALEQRTPSSAYLNSFYTVANPVLSTCNIGIDRVMMYVFHWTFTANPGYVISQCHPYRPGYASSIANGPVVITFKCQAAAQQAANKVNSLCGSDARVAAQSLLAATCKKNPQFAMNRLCAVLRHPYERQFGLIHISFPELLTSSHTLPVRLSGDS